jgi:cell division protein FtsN
MDLLAVTGLVALIIVFGICALICCTISHAQLERELYSDNGASANVLPSYPGPIEVTEQYPPPLNSAMIPAELMQDPEAFPSVTGQAISEFIYQE